MKMWNVMKCASTWDGSPVMIETERLCVRPFECSDVSDLYAILSDPEVMRYIEAPFTYEKTERFLKEYALCESPLVYAVIEKQTEKLIGHLIFHPFDEQAYELGWILSEESWHRGYAKELTQAVIQYASQKKIPSLVIECDPRQTITKHIAVSFGFRETEKTVYVLTL